MKRAGIITTLAMLLMALSASVALATINPANAPSGTHLQSGAIGCAVDPTTQVVTCSSFELSGVGNTNASVSLVASYTGTVDCTNKGGNLVESHTTTFTAGDTFTAASNKNGRLRVREATANPGSVGQVCPNPNWTPTIREGTLAVTSFTYTVTFAGFNSPYITITGP